MGRLSPIIVFGKHPKSNPPTDTSRERGQRRVEPLTRCRGSVAPLGRARRLYIVSPSARRTKRFLLLFRLPGFLIAGQARREDQSQRQDALPPMLRLQVQSSGFEQIVQRDHSDQLTL